MKAIVHIGAPKTGSSSIQEFLFLNTDALAKKGVRFHRNVTGRGSQFEYPLAALTRAGELVPGETERIRYAARTLEEQKASSEPHAKRLAEFPRKWREPVAVFSSEHILPWLKTPESIEALDKMFRETFSEVRYLVYFRSQTDIIVSQYSERTKRGYSFTLDEFIDKRVKTLNIFRPAKRWLDVVGKDRLTVRLMDRAHLKNGDLIEDFCEACGFDFDGLSQPPRVNESLSATGAECLRVLNARIPEIHPDGGFNPLRSNLLQVLTELTADGPKLKLNARQTRKVQKATAQSNNRFRNTFFPELETLFPPKPDAVEPPSEAEIRDMALGAMADLVVKLRLGEIPELSSKQKRHSHVLKPGAPELVS